MLPAIPRGTQAFITQTHNTEAVLSLKNNLSDDECVSDVA